MYKKSAIFIFLMLLLFPFLSQAETLGQRLRGKILLQVESRGEAWYVNPDNNRRYYLARPADAFRLMRELGLGVSNRDFDSWKGVAPKRLAGKILLKVEDLGKAYYVNPIDNSLVYLSRPMDAFKLMREQGLGITNLSLGEISISEGYEYYDPAPPISDNENSEEIVTETEDSTINDGAGTATNTDQTISTSTEETSTSTEEVVATSTEECLFLGEYFTNTRLIGNPVATATYKTIDFNWGLNGPSEISKFDSWSARFTQSCDWEEGEYKFSAKVNDGIKVYLDGTNFLQSWADRTSSRIITRNRTIEAGEHTLKIDYYDNRRYADLTFGWELVE